MEAVSRKPAPRGESPGGRPGGHPADPEPWAKDTGKLPVFQRIRDLAPRRKNAPSFAACLHGLAADLCANLPDGFFEREADTNGLLLLLDGLDEATDAQTRYNLTQEIDSYADSLPEWSAMIVTSRPFDYEKRRLDAQTFAHFDLCEFDDPEIERFVRRWSSAHAESEEAAKTSAEKLLAALEARKNLRELARNALRLAMVIRVHFGHGQLPENRLELYDKCADTLLDKWHEPAGLGPSSADVELKRQFLASLAFQLQSEDAGAGMRQQGQALRVERGELEHKLAAFLAEQDAKHISPKAVIDRLYKRDALLVHEGGDWFAFVHRSFQEYFAARQIATKLAPAEIEALLEADAPGWRETLCLAVASVQHEGTRNRLLLRLLEWNRPIFAREALETIKERRTPPWLRSLIRLLARYYNWTDRDLTARACAELCAGRQKEVMAVLWALFDRERRDGRSLASAVELAEELAARGIGEAASLLGAFLAEAKGLPERMVTVDGARIDAYLVTNAEFERMIPAHRSKRNHYSNQDDQPVNDVNWWEAKLYAQWRGCQLPPDSLWERAACGDPKDPRVKNKYPWGPEWVKGEANTEEAGVGATSPVGKFEGDKSKFGCYDMAGNVIEWTGDVDKDGDPWVRGGSWLDYGDLAACVRRRIYEPSFRFYYLGFRCARTESVTLFPLDS